MKSPLQLDQPGFSLANARALAQFSQAAYADVPPAGAQAFYDPTTDTVFDLHVFGDCIVIVFRGTKDLRNWITDAEFGFRKFDEGRVHGGFLAALESVRAILLKVLGGSSVFKYQPVLPIVVTGHSLGGALAVLCAWFLKAKGYDIHSVYTFGQPRVGDKAFCSAYDAVLGGRTFRLVNCNDIVARIPGWLLGYRGLGHCEFITVTGALVEDPSLLTLAANDLAGLYAAYRRFDDVVIADHFMGKYIAALDAQSTETNA